jgi:hypothetical protein
MNGLWLGGDVKTAQPEAAAPTVLAETVSWEQQADHAGSNQFITPVAAASSPTTA